MAIINGTTGDDVLTGTDGADTIDGGEGSDVIRGLGGNDRLFSGSAPFLGADWMFGDAGNDELTGGEGRQFLFGGTGGDTLYGGNDTDYLFHHGGGVNQARAPGSVSYFGQTTDARNFTFDPYVEDYAVDRLYGGEWSDFVFVGLGDIADGGSETDIVVVSLIGRTGGVNYTDSVSWQAQLSVLTGGSLTNFEGYYLRATDHADNLTGVSYVAAGRGADTITGTGFDDQIATSGWCFTDNVTGSLGALADDGDADYVDAGSGNDTIHAGLNDSIYGGAGNDSVYVSLVRATTGVNLDFSSGDLAPLAEAMNGVLDGIEYLRGLYLTDYADVVIARPGTAVGSSNIQLYGGGGNDWLSGTGYTDLLDGGTGDDILDGGRGNDRMYGGTGNDTYYVDVQQDLVFENADEGMDTVYASSSFYLYDNIETLLLTGTGNSFGVGNALSNTINGNDGANLLLGGGGNDQITGHAGNDNLFGEDGDDELYGATGIDYLVGGAGNDFLYGGHDADALYGEDGDDYLEGGNTFDTDILVGGAGNDTLRGDSGLADYDLMDGGSGDDIYWVDTGDDLTFEAADGGTDTVYADVRVENAGVYLYANVENLVLVGTTAFGVGNELDNSLIGSASGNYLLGGAGNDVLDGRGGNDVLFGEAGNDVFVFQPGSKGDVIGDFTIGQDRIDLKAFGFANFADLAVNFSQVGADGAINLGNGDFIVLHGVTMANLTAAQFIFPGQASPADALAGILAADDARFAAPAPAPVAEGETRADADIGPQVLPVADTGPEVGPQVLPGLGEDDFIVGKGALDTTPQVLPGADELADTSALPDGLALKMAIWAEQGHNLFLPDTDDADPAALTPENDWGWA